MEMSLHLNFNQMTKLFNDASARTMKCNCGHRVIMPIRKDKVICRWCGNYVFKNKRVEFIYRVKEGIYNANRNR